MAEWKPRDTAPDTDDEIVGYSNVIGLPEHDEMPFYHAITTGRFLRSGGWADCTHWMPLPAPPSPHPVESKEQASAQAAQANYQAQVARNNQEAGRVKRIPIAAAQRVAEQYDYDQVIIIARKIGPQNVGGEHVTTYGVDKANCAVAARIGDFIKHKIMG